MLVLWTTSINTLKVTNLLRSMSKNMIDFSSNVIPSIKKVKLKFFSIFKVALRDNLWTELLVTRVNELETVCALV